MSDSPDSPREILGVGAAAGAAEARRAYRRLAMKWHPDRNADPSATARFQEIQRAYRRVMAEFDPAAAMARREAMAAAMAHREARSAEEGRRADFAERINLGVLEQLPLASLLVLVLGIWAGWALPGILGWGAFSAAALTAGAVYKSGVSRAALLAEFWFKAALRAYFFGLLAWAVWLLARKNWELLPGTL